MAPHLGHHWRPRRRSSFIMTRGIVGKPCDPDKVVKPRPKPEEKPDWLPEELFEI